MLLTEIDELKEKGYVPIQNIYYMLAYVFKAPVKSSLRNIDTEEFDNVYDIFAKLLSIYIGQLVKQGLYREYINRCEDIPVVRGKINIAGTIRHKISNRAVLACEYDELSENILVNRILKTTIMLLLRNNRVKPEHKDALKQNLWRFSNVNTIEYASIPWSSIRFHRNNQIYGFLIRICRFIMQEILLTTSSGKRRMERIDDVWKLSSLYEKFVLAYYQQEFRGLHLQANSRQIKWITAGGNQEMLPKMKSDITLTYGNKILIIDTKYYTHNTYAQVQYYDDDSDPQYKIHPANLYQIFTYVKNKYAEVKDNASEKTEVSGMLLYARTDEPMTHQPNNEFKMGDNIIYVKTLNLDCDFSDIKAQLDGIAENILGIKKGAA